MIIACIYLVKVYYIMSFRDWGGRSSAKKGFNECAQKYYVYSQHPTSNISKSIGNSYKMYFKPYGHIMAEFLNCNKIE